MWSMSKLLGTIWTFITYQLFSGYMFYQHGFDDKAFTLFYKHPSSAPLLLLQIGMVIYIFLLFLYLIYIKAHAESENKLPVLFISEVTKPLKRFWELTSLVAVTVVPWIGFVWMWIMFHDTRQKVWERDDVTNIIQIYENVSSPTSFINKWDDYRYGIPPNGDSFVPFWQQIIIMIPLTLIGLTLTFYIMVKARTSLSSNVN